MRPSGDYKYDIQMRAEELAEEIYHTDFYKLPDLKQSVCYQETSKRYWDDRADWADNLRKAAREG